MEALYLLLGAALLAGGFFLGFTVRDKMRSDDEMHVALIEAPLGEPIDIPIAGRHIPPKK